MTKGPVQIEMEGLLAAAFPGADFTLSNDSAQHRGHSGDDGSGESHFSLTIAWAGFAGQNRVERQRAVNKESGRASCRERVCQYGLRAVVAETLKKKKNKKKQ